MKRILASLFAAALVLALVPAPAQAASPEWTGTQVMLTVNGRSDLGSSQSWDKIVSASYFDCRSHDSQFWFVYGGVEFADTSSGFWITPVVGYAGGWFEGHDGLDLGIWAGHGVGNWSYDVDSELITNLDGGNDYYGLYTSGYSFANGMRLAAWSEQTNRDLHLGPRIEVPFGGVNVKIGYLVDLVGRDEDEHAVRIQVGN